MCKEWPALPDGRRIRCRKCALCQFNKVKDWAGRNIAQSKVSVASFACTLTYGPELDQNRMPIPGRVDHVRAAVLTYSDVQKFLKYLRDWLKYDCDFFVTGEFGTEKGRVHWHIILHFKDRVPGHEIGVNFSDRHRNQYGEVYSHEVCKAWPHGFMFWKRAEYNDVFYNCKYILKDEGDEASQRKPQMSKKPPLGAEYFQQVAEQHVRQGLAPQTLDYSFPEIRLPDKSGPVVFSLQGRSAELYLDHYIKTWAEQRPNQQRPNSDLVDLYEEYGQVVFDETALLVRRQFPRGESKRPIPSGAEIKEMARQAEAERQQVNRENYAREAQERWFNWVREVDNEQERQRREEFRDLYTREYGEHEWLAPLDQFHAEQIARGFVWDEHWQEWVHERDYDPGRPRPSPSASPSGQFGQQPERLGKVGRSNRDYRGQ